ncbi:MAG: hypothetical protein IKQ06_05245 [Bacilli bacterium]|nr:hypothetical protein [Bacilli bacterium]MBR6137543.1 hypothetical protein [Bacilli bacterium]
MNSVDNFLNELDSSSLVLDLKEVLNKVKEDKKLVKLLEEYNTYPKENIKNEIIKNKTFQEFKIKETELNLFIMEINQKLKTISKKGSCKHESN